MAFKVSMPRLSDTMEDGKIIKWLKKEGDKVSKGEMLAEVETDKANLEMESFSAGILRKIVIKEGESAPVGAMIAVVGEKDEDIADILKEADVKTAEKEAGPAEEVKKEEEPKEEKKEEAPAPEAKEEKKEKPAEEPEEKPVAEIKEEKPEEEPVKEEKREEMPPKKEGERIFISPLARKMAKEKNLDISKMSGTGPLGRIIKRDIEGYLSGDKELQPAAAVSKEEYREEPLSGIRNVITKRLVESKAPIPHFYVTSEIDMERAIYMKKSLRTHKKEIPVSFNDVMIKATAMALKQFPALNALFQGDKIRYYNVVHMGFAVALEDGLITPVVRNADTKSLFTIAEESRELVERAKEKKLKPEEYTGATFTISNLGMYDVDNFSAIINPPEGAILAVGSIVEKPVVVDDKIEIRSRMKVTVSCDHRVIDGVTAAEFLQELKMDLEKPVGIVL